MFNWKTQCTEKKKKMFTGRRLKCPSCLQCSSIYRHLSLPSTLIQSKWHHTHTHVHTHTHHRSIDSQKATLHRIPNLLACIKRKAYAMQSPITLFSMPFYTPRPPLGVTTDPRGSALQYLQTHTFTIREMCAYLYRQVYSTKTKSLEIRLLLSFRLMFFKCIFLKLYRMRQKFDRVARQNGETAGDSIFQNLQLFKVNFFVFLQCF